MRALAFALLFLAACSSSETPPPAPGGDGGGAKADASASPKEGGTTPAPARDGGTCGLAFYAPDVDAGCQAKLDQTCCAEEKACGANDGCKKLVACVNACPPPRTDDCANSCSLGTEKPPGADELNAIAKCSKGTAGICSWP